MTEDVTLEGQREILKNELQVYLNTRYMWQMRMRAVVNLINKKILKDEDKDPIQKELDKVEAFIEEYSVMLAEAKGLKADG